MRCQATPTIAPVSPHRSMAGCFSLERPPRRTSSPRPTARATVASGRRRKCWGRWGKRVDALPRSPLPLPTLSLPGLSSATWLCQVADTTPLRKAPRLIPLSYAHAVLDLVRDGSASLIGVAGTSPATTKEKPNKRPFAKAILAQLPSGPVYFSSFAQASAPNLAFQSR